MSIVGPFAATAQHLSGVAASATTAAEASAAAGPPGWIVTGILLGVSVLSAVLKKKPAPPPPEAKGFALTENPTDPRAPWLMAYGECWFRPPLLQQAISPASLNGMKAARDQRFTKTYQCGAGPIDGREFRIKHGGLSLFDTIQSTDPAEKRTLTDISNGARTKFIFPIGGVDHSSVALYLDGTLIGATGGGTETTSDTKDTATSKSVTPQTFSKTGVLASQKDSDIPVGRIRTGGILPVQGTVDRDSMSMTAHMTSNATIKYVDGSVQTGKLITVDLSQVAYGITDKGDVYFYLTLHTSVSPALFKKFVLTYTVSTGPTFTLSLDSAQRTVVTFRDPLAAGTLTATYRTSTVSDTFKYVLRKGTSDQAPIAIDESANGDRATYPVGAELTQGTVRRYSTGSEVDELVVGIDSGPDGFFASDGGFGPIARHVQIRLKESSAADQIGSGTDLSSGWIDMKNPDGKRGVVFRLDDFLQGTAHWYFGLASLYAYTKTGRFDPDQTVYLPRNSYDVEVVATDAANSNDKGTVDTSLFHSELHFATATEVRRIGLVVPYQSDVTIQIDQDETIGLDDLIEVKAKWREVWVPSSGSTYSTTTGRPEPGTWTHSRNPVWIACDHIVSRFGGGLHFSWADIASDSTKWAATLAAASYCDDTVTLRSGATETRSLCDICLGEDGQRRSLGEQVASIVAGSGVLAYWRGGWNFLVDRADDPVTDPVTAADFTIVEADDLETASLEMLGIEDIPTDLDIDFRDADKDDEPDLEPITLDDADRSATYPQVVWRRAFPGVRRRSQVRRFGTVILQQSRRNLRTITCVGTWGRGLRLLQLDPGDIVRFTSARLGLTAALYRVFVVGWSSGMKPGLVLVQHDPSVYEVGFQGPTGAVTPGNRVATDEIPAPSKLTVTRVATAAAAVEFSYG